MQHRDKAAFGDAFEIGLQSDRAEGHDHSEFAQRGENGGEAAHPGGAHSPHAGHSHCVEKAAQRNHPQKEQDEPGKDPAHRDLNPPSGGSGGLCLHPLVDIGEENDDGNDREGAGELDDGGKLSGKVGEGVSGRDNRGGVVDSGAGPESEAHVAHPGGASHNRKEDDHDDIKQESSRNCIGNVAVIGVDGGGNRGDGRSAADAGTRRNQVRKLPVHTEHPAEEIAEAEGGGQGEAHHNE